jgi:riboflavin kinase/FMN adenylyltransferase
LKRISNFCKDSCAAALGLFDGVHIGHRAVFDNTVEVSKKAGLTPAAITFSGQTMTKTGGKLILTESEKRAKISEAEIRAYISFDFDEIKDIGAPEFVKLLTENYGIKHIICGEDFRFGHNKSGDVNTLTRLGKEMSFGVTITPERTLGGVKISSSIIREMLKCGEIENAKTMLGYDFYYFEKVVYGSEIGRSLGFPTINQIIPKSKVAPRYGVYLSKTEIDGQVYESLSNIGIKPTVEYKGKPLIETYIESFDGDLYGRKIKVSLTRFIRSEQQFSGLTELREQIEKDKLFMKENYD